MHRQGIKRIQALMVFCFTMKRVLFWAIFLFITLFPFYTDARSGCCSHHGGVCGCGCCDGTPLSTKCAPYYPNCNKAPVTPKYTPPPITTTPKPKQPEVKEAKVPEIEEKEAITTDNTNSNSTTNNNSSSDATAGSVATAGILGGGYWIYKKIKG